MQLNKVIEKWWYLGLPIGFAIGYCLIVKTPDSTDWQIVDRETSIRVLAENSQDLAGVKDGTKIASNVQSMRFTPGSAPPLTVYNFNTERLCGIGGCLHSIYNDRKLLFRVLLSKDSRVSTQDNCLVISQKNASNSQLKSAPGNTAVLRYCYQGSNYVQESIIYR